MKRIYGLALLVLLIALSSCNPRVITKLSKSYQTLDYRQKVTVINIDEETPKNAEVLGQVKIDDAGFSTRCEYEIVIDLAKLEARIAGGNAIKITSHLLPSIWTSTCHRITATILKVENIDSISFAKKNEDELINKSTEAVEYNSTTNKNEPSSEKDIIIRTSENESEFDIIVRTNGNKIDCDIIKDDDNNVYFTIIRNYEEIDTQLSKDKIKEIIYSK